MNLPNKLTLFRIILIPVIMIVYSITPWRNVQVINEWNHLSLCNLFIIIIAGIAMLTDFIDGKIARKYNLVTDLGKFLDPLADKLLVTTLLLILLDQCSYYNLIYRVDSGQNLPTLLSWWMVAIILAREFMVTGIRLIAAGKKVVIAASWYGKIKTTLQFITILYLFAGCAICSANITSYATAYVVIAKILLYFTLVITIFSGADYLAKNWSIITNESKGKTKKVKGK